MKKVIPLAEATFFDFGPFDPDEVADAWKRWCGETAWSRGLRDWAELGGTMMWWCGYPRSKSAIPLSFTLIDPQGNEVPGEGRLKDIETAVEDYT